MATKQQTILATVDMLNNGNNDGGFWLPNIQRPFVWQEKQVHQLFDSIMRGYPISTLLTWKTREEIPQRKFIQSYKNDDKENLGEKVPVGEAARTLVLDGQQRLQSLYIGLRGFYKTKELYFNVLSGSGTSAQEEEAFVFCFLKPEKVKFPFVRFRDLVNLTKPIRELCEQVCNKAGRKLSPSEVNKIHDNIDRALRAFSKHDGIVIQELNDSDNSNLNSIDEVVEIFIRINSGGTKLSKSDLLFSLLVSEWETATEDIEELLREINKGGYDFDKDFILKVCLTLLDKGAAYNIEKMNKPGVADEIQKNWDGISKSVQKVVDYLRSKTYIHSAKALNAFVLIPLINLCYRFPGEWKTAEKEKVAEINGYILRTLLAQIWSRGGADRIIDRMVDAVKKDKDIVKENLFAAVQTAGLSLKITADNLSAMGYDSKLVHLLFNLWYDFDYRPAYKGNEPQIDHIFPQSQLKKQKTGRSEKYSRPVRNQLANCMLLTAQENGAGGKTDKLPEEWFADKDEAYLDKHLIPRDKELWKLENFEDFIEARKELIRGKFSYLLNADADD